MSNTCNTHGKMRKHARKILVTKPEGNRSLARLRCRWENNIKKGLRDNTELTGFIWLKQGPVAGSCEHSR
jgi:hypothetical protein